MMIAVRARMPRRIQVIALNRSPITLALTRSLYCSIRDLVFIVSSWTGQGVGGARSRSTPAVGLVVGLSTHGHGPQGGRTEVAQSAGDDLVTALFELRGGAERGGDADRPAGRQ